MLFYSALCLCSTTVPSFPNVRWLEWGREGPYLLFSVIALGILGTINKSKLCFGNNKSLSLYHSFLPNVPHDQKVSIPQATSLKMETQTHRTWFGFQLSCLWFPWPFYKLLLLWGSQFPLQWNKGFGGNQNSNYSCFAFVVFAWSE